VNGPCGGPPIDQTIMSLCPRLCVIRMPADINADQWKGSSLNRYCVLRMSCPATTITHLSLGLLRHPNHIHLELHCHLQSKYLNYSSHTIKHHDFPLQRQPTTYAPSSPTHPHTRPPSPRPNLSPRSRPIPQPAPRPLQIPPLRLQRRNAPLKRIPPLRNHHLREAPPPLTPLIHAEM